MKTSYTFTLRLDFKHLISFLRELPASSRYAIHR